MIIINENAIMGSSVLAHNIFNSIKNKLMQIVSIVDFRDIENMLDCYNELDLSELDSQEFKSVHSAISDTKISGKDSDLKSMILEAMQADPRFNTA